MFNASLHGSRAFDGYVPTQLQIGNGDYIRFAYCADCGCIQGRFPISNEDIEEALNGN
jgi:hypothetical protein